MKLINIYLLHLYLHSGLVALMQACISTSGISTSSHLNTENKIKLEKKTFMMKFEVHNLGYSINNNKQANKYMFGKLPL